MDGWYNARPWLSTAARGVLGVVLGYAGLNKVTDLDASARAVAAYQLMSWDAAEFVGVIQPFMEIGVGLLLLAGLATRMAALLAGLSMVAFIAGIASAWARGLSIDCGCFSEGGVLPVGQSPNYFWDIVRDAGLLAVAVFLVLFPASRYSLDGRWR